MIIHPIPHSVSLIDKPYQYTWKKIWKIQMWNVWCAWFGQCRGFYWWCQEDLVASFYLSKWLVCAPRPSGAIRLAAARRSAIIKRSRMATAAAASPTFSRTKACFMNIRRAAAAPSRACWPDCAALRCSCGNSTPFKWPWMTTSSTMVTIAGKSRDFLNYLCARTSAISTREIF